MVNVHRKYYEDGTIKKELYYIDHKKLDEFTYYVYVGSLE